jgi:hypothetical protein
MTRDEIVTALRCCASPEVNCKGNCAFFGMTTPNEDCRQKKNIAAADLIENQQRHIEALMKANDSAAYEDTGLKPEEVSAIVKEWSKLFAIVGECGGLDRLRELAEADKAGRLVVLPVKPVLTPILSSMLYIIDDGYIYEDALYEADVGMSESGKTNVVYTTLSDMMVFEQADIGKTVFLTREEAEKALEAMKK